MEFFNNSTCDFSLLTPYNSMTQSTNVLNCKYKNIIKNSENSDLNKLFLVIEKKTYNC